MKMDRNIEGNKGRGKYAILNLRKVDIENNNVMAAIDILVDTGILEWGCKNDPDEFFLIKLKDIGAQDALIAYARVYNDGTDDEWRDQVLEMAKRSGPDHPLCKRAD